VPAVSCNSGTTYSSMWVGIDGYSSNSVEHTGTDSDCSNGSGVFYAWYEMYPKASQLISGLAIHAGDTINAEVKYNGGISFTLSISLSLRHNRSARTTADERSPCDPSQSPVTLSE